MNKFVIFGESHLRHLIREFEQHYSCERYHQGLGGKIEIANVNARNDNGDDGVIKMRSRLGGILNFYRREAAYCRRDVFGALRASDNKYLSLVAYKEAMPTLMTITLPANQLGFAIDDGPTPRIVVLTADGNLHILNAETGVAIGSPLAVSPTTINAAVPGSPVMTLGQGFAYIADPRDGTVTEANLTTWQKGRSFAAGGKPNSVAAFGAWKAAKP